MALSQFFSPRYLNVSTIRSVQNDNANEFTSSQSSWAPLSFDLREPIRLIRFLFSLALPPPLVISSASESLSHWRYFLKGDYGVVMYPIPLPEPISQKSRLQVSWNTLSPSPGIPSPRASCVHIFFENPGEPVIPQVLFIIIF